MDIGTEERLRERGWTEEEIQRAMSAMTSAKESTQKKGLLFSNSFKTLVYWGGLIIAIICNFFASAFMIPLLLVLSRTFLHIIIVTIGLCFGFMFSFLIRDLDKIDEKNHVIGGIFIPALAAINVYVMVDLSNSFNTILILRAGEMGGVFELHNPINISVLYILSFVLPYAILKIWDKDKERKLKKYKESAPPEADQQQLQQGFFNYPGY